MRKTALAVALGTVFIAPAAQAQIVFGNEQIGTVQIYGRLYPQLQTAKTSGSTGSGASVSTLASSTGTLAAGGTDQGTHFGIQTQNSRLGFRGERKLPAGMKALWQLEQTVNFEDPESTAVDNAGGRAGVSENDAIFATRNSFVGLGGGFGTVKLGNMDTIYKEYGDNLSMFGVKSGNFTSGSNMLSHIGFGRNNAARFHERTPNSIQYETPQFAGVTLGVQHMPDERWGNSAVTQRKRLWSYGVKYDVKQFYVSLAREIHHDFFGASQNVGSASLRNKTITVGAADAPAANNDPHAKSRDTATRLSGTWRITGNHMITLDIAKMKWEEDSSLAGTRFRSYQHTNWAIGWEARLGGPWRAAAQFVRGGEGTCSLSGGAACSTGGLRSSMLSGGVAYDLDRQTRLYTFVSRLNNGPSARYDNSSLLDPDRGADITQTALGISYSF